MKVAVENLGGTDILIPAIEQLAQIYRFDEFRISIDTGVQQFVFEVPSTEWLEEFSSVLRSVSSKRVHKTLRGSGYSFDVSRTDDGIALTIFDVLRSETVMVSLSLDEAAILHQAVLDSVLMPFVEQGGRIEDLRDIDLFHIPGLR